MKCKAAQKLMSRRLDDELASEVKRSVDVHVAQCPACQSAYASQQRVWALLGHVEPIQPPDVIAAVEKRLLEHRGWPSLFGGFGIRNVGYAIAVAALVGLFVGTGVWAGDARQDAETGEHDRAVAELLSDIPPGMEVVTVLDEIGERP
jgi:predicted anti-sigma-YlaC factor YlaD